MIHKHTVSLRNALRGLLWVFKTQPNFKVHVFFSVLSLSFSILFHISYSELLVIFLLITMGFTIETINTAIEETTDAIDLKWRKDIGLAKDISAGAMLVYSLGAAIIGLIIFTPKIILLLKF